MIAPAQIVSACWIGFFGAWFVFALPGGTGRRGGSAATLLVRWVLVATALVLALNFADWIPALPFARSPSALAVTGAVLCIAGLAFGVWARAALGRNWGMPMTLHEDPELVTSGPYRYVRHPIYTGMSAMVLGTTLVYPVAVIWAVIMVTYMMFSARREERDMTKRFPDTYPAYTQRSKLLVPFVL